MTLFDLLTAHRRFVYLVIALLSAAGVAAAFRLPSAIYPELNFSRITIVARGSSLGTRQVVFSVARPIEEAVSVVPGVSRVHSRSIRGATEITVTFAPRTDMLYALQLVQARINEVAQRPPGRTRHPGGAADPLAVPDPVVQSRGRGRGDTLRHCALPDPAGDLAEFRAWGGSMSRGPMSARSKSSAIQRGWRRRGCRTTTWRRRSARPRRWMRSGGWRRITANCWS